MISSEASPTSSPPHSSHPPSQQEYINFLKNVTPENQEQYARELKTFAFVSDCPVFDRIFDYCQVWVAASAE